MRQEKATVTQGRGVADSAQMTALRPAGEQAATSVVPIPDCQGSPSEKGVHVRARPLDRPLHRLRGALARLERRRARERVQHGLLGGQRVAQRLHRRHAGHLARRMPAHAVGHRIEPERLVDQVGVLVVRAFLADVGARPAPDDRMARGPYHDGDHNGRAVAADGEALSFRRAELVAFGMDVRLRRK